MFDHQGFIHICITFPDDLLEALNADWISERYKICRSDFLALFHHGFELTGDDRSSLGLPLHVSAGSAACDPGLLEAFDIIADKCGIDYVLTGFTAEFADVVVEVE